MTIINYNCGGSELAVECQGDDFVFHGRQSNGEWFPVGTVRIDLRHLLGNESSVWNPSGDPPVGVMAAETQAGDFKTKVMSFGYMVNNEWGLDVPLDQLEKAMDHALTERL